jgi:tetratricopeptide (TPR) repeat protein
MKAAQCANDSGDTAASQAAARESITITADLARNASGSKVVEAQRRHARNLIDFARLVLESDDLATARRAGEEATSLLRWLVNADEANASDKEDLARALEVMGHVALHIDDHRLSRAVNEEVLRLRLELVQAEPQNAHLRASLGVAYNNLGASALDADDIEDSVKWFEVSCRVYRDVLVMKPDNTKALSDLGQAAYRVGHCASLAGQTEKARAAYEESAEIRRRLAAGEPPGPIWHDLGKALMGACGQQSELDDDEVAIRTAREAVAAYRNAVTSPADGQEHRDLSLMLFKSAVCADSGRDVQSAALQALEAADIWSRYGTGSTGTRWPQLGGFLDRLVGRLLPSDRRLAATCRAAARRMGG